MSLKIIVAISSNGVIGRDNNLPFDLPDDRSYFKRITRTLPVVMGTKTFFSLPKEVRPLPERENIVLTRSPDEWIEMHRITLTDNFEEILKRSEGEDIFVIGGSKVYELALPHATELYITQVHTVCEGDVLFPHFDEADWTLVSTVKHEKDERHAFPFAWQKYVRPNRFIEIANCRTELQREKMLRITEAGHCPFCPEHLSLYHKNPILWKGLHWSVTENDYPYTGTEVHLLLILNTHAETAGEVPSGAYEELSSILRWAENRYKIRGLGFYMRSGECKWTGATIRHIHAHIASKSVADSSIQFYL